ncbi:MAG: hypothetical protein A3F90_13555 [Deltaproteobacteria bacterium RIFCSPLOWO2_12_FULL_60_19]|nr:MAG: hypothetical protein A3F90_13555 [Deltaproteobacteria bacterium RIFCSPLOWO2_12_FULL_60_19]
MGLIDQMEKVEENLYLAARVDAMSMAISPKNALARKEPAGALPRALTVAALVPCYNEEASIRKVVQDFREALPRATIYVYDNNSTDGSVEVAPEAGAIVYFEPL